MNGDKNTMALTLRKVNWVNLIVASVIATAIVTISMLISGTDIVKALGAMILGGGADTNMQYLVGGLFHLSVGISYGFLFTLFFAPVSEWNKFIKGVVFGFVMTATALTLMPVMATMMGDVTKPAANPCASKAMNPCSIKSANPCSNPCSINRVNPCNHCAAVKTAKPSIPVNPCNPCSPKSGGNPYAGLVSLMNHIIFGLAFAFLVRLRS